MPGLQYSVIYDTWITNSPICLKLRMLSMCSLEIYYLEYSVNDDMVSGTPETAAGQSALHCLAPAFG